MAEIKTLQINTGRINLPVRDPYGKDSFLSFNPADADFRKRFLEMASKISGKQAEYKEAGRKLDLEFPVVDKDVDDMTDAEKDTYLKRTMEENKMEDDFCTFCETEIDNIFGEDASKKVFGGDRVIFAYMRFLDAMEPYISESADGFKDEYLKLKANRQQRRAAK